MTNPRTLKGESVDYTGNNRVVKKHLRDGSALTVDTVYCAGCRRVVATNMTTEYADGALYCRRCADRDAK